MAAIFAGRKGPNACWCQRFRHDDLADNQAALRQEIDNSSVPIGLVAYVGQSPRAGAGLFRGATCQVSSTMRR